MDELRTVKSVSGNIVDVVNSAIYPGTIEISAGRIRRIVRDEKEYETYIIPCFIDAHVHIESSMLVPSEFARLAVIHGTAATVSDPHEIANVMGISGVDYMIEDSRSAPFKFFFGAPSCVPASRLETSGAHFGPAETERLLRRKEIRFLSEMMNFPGVLEDDPEVHAKLAAAKNLGKPVDGHSPGLRGESLRKYIAAGISTDHETTEYEEGREKILSGMKVIIREGSSARNLDALAPLVDEFPGSCMFCSDDKDPVDLIEGHIDVMVRRALRGGADIFRVLRCASVNPVLHYGLDVGLLRKGDAADFLVLDDLDDLEILMTCIGGRIVAEKGNSLLPRRCVSLANNFRAQIKRAEDFGVSGKGMISVIEAADGQLVTGRIRLSVDSASGKIVSDTARDILKIAVINRYAADARPAVGFVKNFGLRKGAIASSVAHDSHNIVVVGVTDDDICRAANLVIENRGGLAAVSADTEMILPLPVAGLMSAEDGFTVAEHCRRLDAFARQWGSTMKAPFMTLSFMSLSVIPELKLTDKGLVDVRKAAVIDLFEAP